MVVPCRKNFQNLSHVFYPGGNGEGNIFYFFPLIMSYDSECVAGVGLIDDNETGEITEMKVMDKNEIKRAKVVDNTEGTGAYDDLGPGALVPGTMNFDNGGCGLDINTLYLKERYGVVNHVYDKIKRSPEHNECVLKLVAASVFDTSTSNSVLNVIESRDELLEHIRLSFQALKPGGQSKAYFKVWKGNGSSVASKSCDKNSYQSNRCAETYLGIIKEVFSDSVICYNQLNLIVATK